MSDDWRERKVTVEVARRILGGSANHYSDEQLKMVIHSLYKIAEFFIRS